MIRRTFLGCVAVGAVGAAFSYGPDRFDFSWLSGEIAASPLGALAGKRVQVAGFVLPHNSARRDFFLLAERASAICPHCQPAPDGLAALAVYPRAMPVAAHGTWEGTLDVGAKTDPDTGYFSLARLFDAAPRSA